MFILPRFRAVLICTTFLAFTACAEHESTPVEPGGIDATINQIVTTTPINASAPDTLVRFSFVTGTTVAATAPWDVAFRRYEVRLNGGVSGSGGVTGYSFGNNKDATSAQVLAFTADNTRPAFDSIRSAQIPVDSFFRSDRLFANINGFLNLAGRPTANAAAYWKVRLANGAFAAVRVTAITLSATSALSSVTFESRLQTGTTLASTATAFTVAVTGSPVSVSVVTGAAVTPSGCNWDLLVTPQTYGITVNSACNVGTYPGATTPNFAAVTLASDAPEYAAYLSGLTGPIPNSTSDLQAPFRYNLSGNNRLDPAFNTYLIRNGLRIYKLQVIGYYNNSAAAGYPTIRYSRIR